MSSGGGVTAAALVLLLVGCSPPATHGTESEETAGGVATVEGEALTAEDLRVASGAGPEAHQRALDQAILRRLAAAEARRRGLDAKPDLEGKLLEIEREAKARKEALLRDELFANVRDGLVLSEDALRAHYEATKLRYAERQLRLRRRAFPTRADADRARREGMAWEGEGAETLGPSLVRDLPRTVLPEALGLERPGARAVAGSDEEGWSLIELAEVLPAEPRPFEAVRAVVEANLRQKEAAAAFRALLDELRATADVRVDEEALGQLDPRGEPNLLDSKHKAKER